MNETGKLLNPSPEVGVRSPAVGELSAKHAIGSKSGQKRFAFMSEQERAGFGITFRDSGRLPVHRWYPYVEGFSARYVQETLTRYAPNARAAFDPFGGAGTTQLTCSTWGVPSFYCELNPFMRFVAEAKVTSAAWARRNLSQARKACIDFLSVLNGEGDRVTVIDELIETYHAAFPKRDFFDLVHLSELLRAKVLAGEVAGEQAHIRSLLLVACAANVVGSSHMTRRADLRRRRPDEYRNRIVDVRSSVTTSVRKILKDIESLPLEMASTSHVSADCRDIPEKYADTFDIAITSPPYLNGTNYFRNTKLELWYLGFLASENGLSEFRAKAVCGGINDVAASRDKPIQFDCVERIATCLDESATDKRIPRMVRYYFSDMANVLSGTHRSLRQDARLILDIGDSCFYGVHLPTDDLLMEVGESIGFEVEHSQVLAKRYSKTQKQLRQTEIVFRKKRVARLRAKSKLSGETLTRRISNFAEQLPYLAEPFSRRNWGHTLHSLCSYQGKLKPGIAHWLVRSFVPDGGSMLDPLGGVGTIAFEASLMERKAVSSDKSPFASLIGRAKLNPPSISEALAALEDIGRKLDEVRLCESDKHDADFGLNATVADYYHPETLIEVLKARRMFRENTPRLRGELFVWASLLHILHGNRPYALSRRSHPITPFSPTGPTEYKPLVDGVRSRIYRALSASLPPEFLPGEGLNFDFRKLPASLSERFDAIITSPPFAGMRFDRPNWLRLWFCGWGERSFHEESKSYLEREQSKSLDCYTEFFAVCHRLLQNDGLLIVHMGGSERDPLPARLAALGNEKFKLIADVAEDVAGVEKHGLKDKGRTTSHHFLFFRPR